MPCLTPSGPEGSSGRHRNGATRVSLASIFLRISPGRPLWSTGVRTRLLLSADLTASVIQVTARLRARTDENPDAPRVPHTPQENVPFSASLSTWKDWYTVNSLGISPSTPQMYGPPGPILRVLLAILEKFFLQTPDLSVGSGHTLPLRTSTLVISSVHARSGRPVRRHRHRSLTRPGGPPANRRPLHHEALDPSLR